MQNLIYNVVNPDKNVLLEFDAVIRYELENGSYIEVTRCDNGIEIRCSGRNLPLLNIQPQLSNTVRISAPDRYHPE